MAIAVDELSNLHPINYTKELLVERKVFCCVVNIEEVCNAYYYYLWLTESAA